MILPALLAALALASTGAPPPSPHRFAILIGDDHGLPGDEPLRFAGDDARSMLSTLEEVGGVSAEDSELLLDADANQVVGALSRWERLLQAEHAPDDQLVLYVSSHAEGGVLHLAGSTLPVEALTDFLERVPVSVAVLVIDSCESGTATGLKGLKRSDQPVIGADRLEVKGRVVLSSSGPNEYAQESEALGGSFFTHHLITALRGAADVSGDGKVTLAEAYLYAYRNTLESTFGTPGGVQHPSYHFDLRGEGELVLSQPDQASSRLRVVDPTPGEWLIARARGGAVDRFEKPAGPAVFALPAGRYRMQTERDGNLLQASVDVPARGEVVLEDRQLAPAPVWATLLKGGGAPPYSGELTFVGGTGIVPGLHGAFGAALTVDRLWARPLGPFSWTFASLGFRSARAIGPVQFRENELALTVGAGWAGRMGALGWRAGAGPGVTAVRQGAIASGSRDAVGLGLDARVELRAPLTARASLLVGGTGGPTWAKRAEGFGLLWQAQAEAGVAFSFE